MNGLFPALPQADRFTWISFGRLLAALLLGFLVLRTDIGRALSDGISYGLARLAAVLLGTLQADVLRTGSELRNTTTGDALSVTSACDGLGLTIALLAGLAALAVSPFAWMSIAAISAAGFIVLQLFNMLRILTLYGLLPATSSAFALAHYQIFPLASAVIVAAIIAMSGRRLSPVTSSATIRGLLLWCGVAIAAALLWHIAGEVAVSFLVTPLSNAMIHVVPGILVDGIRGSAGTFLVDTNLVTSQSPLSTASLPFAPTDFTISVPLLAASLGTASVPWKRKLFAAALAAFSFALAMTIAAYTLAQDEASVSGLKQLVSSSRLETYQAPGAVMRGLLVALQNAIVYFNLFFLPFIVFFLGDSPSHDRRPAGSRRRRNG